MRRLAKYLPDAFGVAGFVSICVGIAQWSRAAALIFAGVCMCGVAYTLASLRK